MTAEIKVTQPAKNRIDAQREEKGVEDLKLRIIVKAGGCSGFEYLFDLDSSVNDDDIVFEDRVVIDETSLSILDGSVLDYVEELIGSDFKINNPNAVSGCGCGQSFAITGI